MRLFLYEYPRIPTGARTVQDFQVWAVRSKDPSEDIFIKCVCVSKQDINILVLIISILTEKRPGQKQAFHMYTQLY